jgi:GNAT superfamily N-acetyltransferase
LYWLGRSVPDAQVIDLNKIEIKQIEEYGVVNEFLSKYHYLNGRAGVAFGAFYDDTLIAVCVFSKCVRKQMADRVADFSTVLELSRFCIRPEYQVHNLGSWMLSRCVKRIKALKPEIMALISFADTTYDHTGALYKACNWQLDGEVEPDYWYRDAEGFVMHKLTLYRHAVQLSLTESAYCEKYGYQKVYGDKKYRFLWRF